MSLEDQAFGASSNAHAFVKSRLNARSRNPLLLGYWTMDEATGDRADATGRGSPMREHLGYPITNTSGQIGNAALFQQDPNLAHKQALVSDVTKSLKVKASRGFTATGWFNFVGPITGELGLFNFNSIIVFGRPVFFYIFAYTNAQADDIGVNQFGMKIEGYIPTQRFYLYAGPEIAITGPIKNDFLPTFWCFWFDPTDQLLRMQFNNGTVIASNSTYGIIQEPKGSVFGGENHPNGGSVGFASSHYSDEFALWSRVLSATERTTLYNNYLMGIRPI